MRLDVRQHGVRRLPVGEPAHEVTLVLRMIGQIEKETAQADGRLNACSGEVDTGSPIGTCISQYFLEHVPIPKEQDMLWRWKQGGTDGRRSGKIGHAQDLHAPAAFRDLVVRS